MLSPQRSFLEVNPAPVIAALHSLKTRASCTAEHHARIKVLFNARKKFNPFIKNRGCCNIKIFNVL